MYRDSGLEHAHHSDFYGASAECANHGGAIAFPATNEHMAELVRLLAESDDAQGSAVVCAESGESIIQCHIFCLIPTGILARPQDGESPFLAQGLGRRQRTVRRAMPGTAAIRGYYCIDSSKCSSLPISTFQIHFVGIGRAYHPMGSLLSYQRGQVSERLRSQIRWIRSCHLCLQQPGGVQDANFLLIVEIL